MTDTTDSSTPISRRSRKLKSGSARAAFQSRDFRRIWFGSFASNIGTWIQNVVLPVYIYSRTGRASFVAVVIFAQLGPILLLSIPGGVIADRIDRKKFLVSMQTLQLSCSLLLAFFRRQQLRNLANFRRSTRCRYRQCTSNSGLVGDAHFTGST